MIPSRINSWKEKVNKYIRVRAHRFKQACIKRWKRVPVTRKKVYLYAGNYVANATLISFFILYVTYWDILWLRFTGIIPAITIFLFYFEHYYKWVRLSYKD
jgi:hypothetical protein